jgi:hypothetical protein
MPGAFLWDNKITSATTITCSPGSVLASMPLSNLSDPQPRARARFLTTSGIFRLVVDLGSTVLVEAVVLVSTTLRGGEMVNLYANLNNPAAGGNSFDMGDFSPQTTAALNGNVVMIPASPSATRYLFLTIYNAPDIVDIGRMVAGPLWKLTRSHAYGIAEGRAMLDRRDRNALTGAEFPVPAVGNPRTASFSLPALTSSEARGAHRNMVAGLGAAGDALWIPDLSLSLAEINARSVWGAVNLPGQVAATTRTAFPVYGRQFQITERL